MWSKVLNLLLLLATVGGVILFVILAPILIWAVTMLALGGIAFAILAFIVYAIFEAIKERKN